MIRGRWAVVITVVSLCSATLAIACFSERQDPGATGPDIECRARLGDVAGTTVVGIRDFAFVPDTIRVRPGATITWVNCEEKTAHTTTSDGGVWSSPLLAPGESFSHTYDQPGSFPYHCSPHPFMKGTVIVE